MARATIGGALGDRLDRELEALADRLARPRREGVEPDGQLEIGRGRPQPHEFVAGSTTNRRRPTAERARRRARACARR